MRILSFSNKKQKIAILFSIFLFSSCLSDEEMKKLALASPVEDILQYPEVASYLQKHKVYISLTTSPFRIKSLKMVLDTLDLTHVEAILLVIPDKYRNSDQQPPYVVPEEVKTFGKLQIIKITKDLGPLSKLTPAVDYLLDQMKIGDDETILITIDDDRAYPQGQISGLIKHLILKDAVANGGSGFDVPFFNVRREDWPKSQFDSPACYFGSGRCDVVEAATGTAYKLKHIKDAGGTKELERLSQLGYAAGDKNCFFSDDLVINFALARAKITKWAISDQFVYRPFVYTIGRGSDALYLGGQGETSRHNWGKYELCFSRYLSKEIKAGAYTKSL